MRNVILSLALLIEGCFLQKGFAEESSVEAISQDQFPGIYSIYSSFGLYAIDVQLMQVGESLFVYMLGATDAPYELLPAEMGGFYARALPGFQIHFVKSELGNIEVDILTPYGTYRGYKQI